MNRPYTGVTVERKEGLLRTSQGARITVLDLPGAYSLNALSADEAIARDIATGQRPGEPLPDLLVCVVDATRLALNLRLVIEARSLGLPMVVALNMGDAAQREGVQIDRERLARELGLPVVDTVGVRADGAQALVAWLDGWATAAPPAPTRPQGWQPPDWDGVLAVQAEVRRVLDAAVRMPPEPSRRDEAIDRVVLHPVGGLLILAATLFLMFQAVFSWAEVPKEWIQAGVNALADAVRSVLAPGLLQSLLCDGILAGAGGVLVFLPQILLLFLFILALEDSGYLPRAAFLLDRVMGAVGLSGRSFIPLLSSFACAIPGVMATRTIPDARDRLLTILIAPLMTCSARLPVYTLLIAAFIPARSVAGVFNLQGLVLFGLYLAGIASAMAVAAVARRWRGRQEPAPLVMELPTYRWPSPRHLAMGLWERARIFLQRVGGIILALMVLLWFLASFPAPPDGAVGPAIQYSLAARIGHALEWLFAPIGFNWQIAIALVPGLAAREVAVGALGTVYALSAGGDDLAGQLGPLIAQQWSLATALALLVWYVFAPQCVATLATVRRETGGWRAVGILAAYLFGLAYAASGLTYHLTRWIAGGA